MIELEKIKGSPLWAIDAKTKCNHLSYSAVNSTHKDSSSRQPKTKRDKHFSKTTSDSYISP